MRSICLELTTNPLYIKPTIVGICNDGAQLINIPKTLKNKDELKQLAVDLLFITRELM